MGGGARGGGKELRAALGVEGDEVERGAWLAGVGVDAVGGVVEEVVEVRAVL